MSSSDNNNNNVSYGCARTIRNAVHQNSVSSTGYALDWPWVNCCNWILVGEDKSLTFKKFNSKTFARELEQETNSSNGPISYVYCSENRKEINIALDGRQVPVVGNLILDSIPKDLTSLILLNMQELEGGLPQDWKFKNLQELNIVNSSLSGSIPENVWSQPSLRKLNLSYNNLNGSLPLSFGSNLSNLISLDLSNNQFQGSIPDVSELKNMTFCSFAQPSLCSPSANLCSNGLQLCQNAPNYNPNTGTEDKGNKNNNGNNTLPIGGDNHAGVIAGIIVACLLICSFFVCVFLTRKRNSKFSGGATSTLSSTSHGTHSTMSTFKSQEKKNFTLDRKSSSMRRQHYRGGFMETDVLAQGYVNHSSQTSSSPKLVKDSPEAINVSQNNNNNLPINLDSGRKLGIAGPERFSFFKRWTFGSKRGSNIGSLNLSPLPIHQHAFNNAEKDINKNRINVTSVMMMGNEQFTFPIPSLDGNVGEKDTLMLPSHLDQKKQAHLLNIHSIPIVSPKLNAQHCNLSDEHRKLDYDNNTLLMNNMTTADPSLPEPSFSFSIFYDLYAKSVSSLKGTLLQSTASASDVEDNADDKNSLKSPTLKVETPVALVTRQDFLHGQEESYRADKLEEEAYFGSSNNGMTNGTANGGNTETSTSDVISSDLSRLTSLRAKNGHSVNWVRPTLNPDHRNSYQIPSRFSLLFSKKKKNKHNSPLNDKSKVDSSSLLNDCLHYGTMDSQQTVPIITLTNPTLKMNNHGNRGGNLNVFDGTNNYNLIGQQQKVYRLSDLSNIVVTVDTSDDENDEPSVSLKEKEARGSPNMMMMNDNHVPGPLIMNGNHIMVTKKGMARMSDGSRPMSVVSEVDSDMEFIHQVFNSEGIEGLRKLVKRGTVDVSMREKIMYFLEGR